MMGDGKLNVDNPLAISWHDSAWIPILNPHNVMDYFSERSNPFYERTCNNEIIKMQRASQDQLQNLQGVEYCLLHVQEPILYVIRKQHRHSPTHVTPISDYYIIAGTVYQAPDLGSVLNSRLLSTVNHLQSAFEEARKFSKYHPSKGYWWDFEKKMSESDKLKEEQRKKRIEKRNKKFENERKAKEEPSSIFQRRRVDMLLDLLTKKFPPKIPAQTTPAAPAPIADAANAAQGANGEEVKTESVKSESKTEVGVKRENSTKSGGLDVKKAKLG